MRTYGAARKMDDNFSDPPKYSNSSLSEDPPVIVEKPIGTLDPRNVESLFADSYQWLDEHLGGKSYGAPRVFDLFTLLAVTLAFAILFAFLRLLEPLLLATLPQVAVAITAFVTLTAIAQITLLDGNKPRLASLLAGPPIWLVVSLGLCLQDLSLLNFAFLILLVMLSVLGIPAGYLGGAMVAGVFLLADSFRQKFMRRENRVDPDANDDAIWKE